MSAFLLPFIVIMVLIALNGMFVAAEFAIIGVRPTRIAQLAEEGSATAKRIHTIIQDQTKVDRYIASAQLGITLASLGLGMYGEPAIAHLIEPPLHDWFGIGDELLHTISFFIALGIITYLHVVVGEMVPKSMALQSAERVVLALATPMLLMQKVFAIPIRVLNAMGMLVLRLVGVEPPSEESRLHTPYELELIISESVSGGLVHAEEQTLIANIFDFTNLIVGQVMTPRNLIEAVPVDISEADMMKKMFTSPHSRMPVYKDDMEHIIGIVHIKDLVHHYLDDPPFDLRTLAHEVPFVPEGMRADHLLAQLKREQVHMAIVVDEFGGTAGVVTLEDLLEEIVGDVRDEFDSNEATPVTVVDEGTLIVKGRTRLDELAPYVPLAIDEERTHADTVGGVVMSERGLPLEVGDTVQVGDVTLKVEALKGLAVTRVRVEFPSESS